MAPSARAQFAKLSVLTVLISFGLAGLFGPPDPFTQLRILGVCMAVGLIGSYWLCYRSSVDLSTLRWDDLFRWAVSTYLFVLLIALVTGFNTAFAFDTLAGQLVQLVVLVVAGGLAWIVVYTDRVPWPGDY